MKKSGTPTRSLTTKTTTTSIPISKATPTPKRVRISSDVSEHDDLVRTAKFFHDKFTRFEINLMTDGRPYYYDYETSESRWGSPPSDQQDEHQLSTSGSDRSDERVVEFDERDRLVILKDEHGRKYRYDRDSGESKWVNRK